MQTEELKIFPRPCSSASLKRTWYTARKTGSSCAPPVCAAASIIVIHRFRASPRLRSSKDRCENDEKDVYVAIKLKPGWILCRYCMYRIFPKLIGKFSQRTHRAHQRLEEDRRPKLVILNSVMKYEKYIDQHGTSMGQRKNLSPRQELNPWPPEHRLGALSTELRELDPWIARTFNWVHHQACHFFFVPHSCHVDEFKSSFKINLPENLITSIPSLNTVPYR